MIATTKTYPIYAPLFWRAYLVQMRPYLLFVSGIAGAAGMAMNSNPTLNYGKFILAFLPFLMGYGFGQALTDCFQTDTDKLSAPYRPLSKGIISIRAVLAVSISGLLLCAIILFSFHLYSFLLSGLTVFGLATYSYIKKHSWAAGPFYNAWIVGLLPLMGYFVLAGSETTAFPTSYLPFLFVSFFSYASFVLIGYLKDIEADKATGYRTFPVIWGWKRTVLAGDAIAAATLCFLWFGAKHNTNEMAAGLAGSVIILYGQYRGHRSKQQNETEALQPILATVRSFILFHLAIVFHFQPHWWLPGLIYYGLFEMILYKRPSRNQV